MKATVLLAVVVLAVMIVGGCEKFTLQNYEMIQKGDSPERVKDVLGKPTLHSTDLWWYYNEKPYYRAKIYFENNQVSRKDWFDAENRWVQPE